MTHSPLAPGGAQALGSLHRNGTNMDGTHDAHRQIALSCSTSVPISPLHPSSNQNSPREACVQCHFSAMLAQDTSVMHILSDQCKVSYHIPNVNGPSC